MVNFASLTFIGFDLDPDMVKNADENFNDEYAFLSIKDYRIHIQKRLKVVNQNFIHIISESPYNVISLFELFCIAL